MNIERPIYICHAAAHLLAEEQVRQQLQFYWSVSSCRCDALRRSDGILEAIIPKRNSVNRLRWSVSAFLRKKLDRKTVPFRCKTRATGQSKEG
jgi:hypothetical protein